jgi:hypothetical protein
MTSQQSPGKVGLRSETLALRSGVVAMLCLFVGPLVAAAFRAGAASLFQASLAALAVSMICGWVFCIVAWVHGVRSRRLALAALLSAAPLVLSGVFSVYWVWSAQA